MSDLNEICGVHDSVGVAGGGWLVQRIDGRLASNIDRFQCQHLLIEKRATNSFSQISPVFAFFVVF